MGQKHTCESAKAFLKGRKTGFICKFWSISMTPGSEFVFPIRIRIQDSQINADPDSHHFSPASTLSLQEQKMDRIAREAKLEVKRSEEEWGRRTFHQPQSSSLGNHIWASSLAFS
jgi:hypothetical protein